MVFISAKDASLIAANLFILRARKPTKEEEAEIRPQHPFAREIVRALIRPRSKVSRLARRAAEALRPLSVARTPYPAAPGQYLVRSHI
jgi:hypothetical protein